MIRTSLLAVNTAGSGGQGAAANIGDSDNADEGGDAEILVSAVPEEFFRRYTETDSRPLTPAPTLASGLTALTNQESLPVTCNPRERTTLILDLRANSRGQQVVGNRQTMPLDRSLLLMLLFSTALSVSEYMKNVWNVT